MGANLYTTTIYDLFFRHLSIMLKRLTADMRRYIVCAVSALFFLITDFSSITETTAGSHRRIVDHQHGSNWDAKQ
jgi:hypothetical protein